MNFVETHDKRAMCAHLLEVPVQLNHLDLHVPNVSETCAFFIRYLDFKLVSSPASQAIAVLENDSNFVLVLQKQKNATDSYPDGFHIGFYVNQRGRVDELHQTLSKDGFLLSKIDDNRRGYFFYIRAPGGFLVEINAR